MWYVSVIALRCCKENGINCSRGGLAMDLLQGGKDVANAAEEISKAKQAARKLSAQIDGSKTAARKSAPRKAKTPPYKQVAEARHTVASKLFADNKPGLSLTIGSPVGSPVSPAISPDTLFNPGATMGENMGAIMGADALADEARRSNDYADVARRILELSGTVKEAIDHLLSKLYESEIEHAAVMLTAICEGLDGIEKAAASIQNGPAALSPAAQSPAAQSPAAQSLAAQSLAAQSLAAQSPAAQDISELTDRLMEMAEAYAQSRYDDLRPQGEAFKSAYDTYDRQLSRSFRAVTIN
jgi:hypothetical protein